jgi:DNA-binding YbaB/EbfC family protein
VVGAGVVGAGVVVGGAWVVVGAVVDGAVDVVRPLVELLDAGAAAGSAPPHPASSTAAVRTTAARRTPAACHGLSDPPHTLVRMRPGGQPDMQQLMKQAQKMQQQLAAAQEQLAQAEVTGTAGGGMVTATMTGSGELTAIAISPQAVDPDDVETLQDLVVAAVRDANRAAGELTQTTMGPLTGGMGGMGLPGF